MLLTEASKRVTVDTPDFSQPMGTLIVAVNPFSLNRITFVFEWLTLNPGSFCSRRILRLTSLQSSLWGVA